MSTPLVEAGRSHCGYDTVGGEGTTRVCLTLCPWGCPFSSLRTGDSSQPMFTCLPPSSHCTFSTPGDLLPWRAKRLTLVLPISIVQRMMARGSWRGSCKNESLTP